jgi:hypothetical protein
VITGVLMYCTTVTLHPPLFPIHYILWYIILNVPPPPDTPFSHIFSNDFLMTLFLHPPPPRPLFHREFIGYYQVTVMETIYIPRFTSTKFLPQLVYTQSPWVPLSQNMWFWIVSYPCFWDLTIFTGTLL